MRVVFGRMLAISSCLAILVTACTVDEPTRRVDRNASAAHVCRDDPFGCVRVAPGKPIRLAAIAPFSAQMPERKGATQAMQLAVELHRPFLGHHVVLTRRSDGCVGEPGGVSRLASDPTIVAVIGVECPSMTAVSAEILGKKGMVFVSTMNSNPRPLTNPAIQSRFFLRTSHNDADQGTAMARFVRERLASQTIATVHDGSPYTKGLVTRFAAEFLEGRGRVVVRRTLRVGEQDFRRHLARVETAGADFLYAPVFVAEGAVLAKQVRETHGLQDVVVGGAEGIFTPDWLGAAGSAAEDVYVATPDYRFRQPRFDLEFMPRFEQRFGRSDNVWSGFLARGFDAANLVLDAVEDVAIQEKGALYIPRTALRDRMFATKDYRGLSGTLSCDANGNCNHSTPVVIYQVRNGAFRKVWTWDPAA